MGHWGTCAIDFQQFNFFQLTLELHEVWLRLCAVASPNIFVFCDSGCGSSVAATWTLFSVLFRRFASFYVRQKVSRSFVPPPLAPDHCTWQWWCNAMVMRCSLLKPFEVVFPLRVTPLFIFRHGDRGPRARSCTSKTFGDLTHSFAATGCWRFGRNPTPST